MIGFRLLNDEKQGETYCSKFLSISILVIRVHVECHPCTCTTSAEEPNEDKYLMIPDRGKEKL